MCITSYTFVRGEVCKLNTNATSPTKGASMPAWIAGYHSTSFPKNFYPFVAVPKMGKFTQNWYGKKWVKIG